LLLSMSLPEPVVIGLPPDDRASWYCRSLAASRPKVRSQPQLRVTPGLLGEGRSRATGQQTGDRQDQRSEDRARALADSRELVMQSKHHAAQETARFDAPDYGRRPAIRRSAALHSIRKSRCRMLVSIVDAVYAAGGLHEQMRTFYTLSCKSIK
jgi:hypothetical protein